MGRISNKERLKRLSEARDKLVRPVFATGYISELGILHLTVVDSLGRSTGRIFPNKDALQEFIDGTDITVVIDGNVVSVSTSDQKEMLRSADNQVLQALIDCEDITVIQNMLNNAYTGA